MHQFRTLILSAAIALAASPAAHAGPLDDVSRHLAETRTMTARFQQMAGNGTIESGRLTLSLPGKARFEYDKAKILVVADGRALNLIDYEVDQVTTWPIRGTPLAVILDPTIDLARFARVLPATGDKLLRIETRDAKHPEYGVTTLSFARDAAAPGGLRLLGWKVLDSQGNVTQVELTETKFNQPVNSAAFRFRDPRPRRVPGRS